LEKGGERIGTILTDQKRKAGEKINGTVRASGISTKGEGLEKAGSRRKHLGKVQERWRKVEDTTGGNKKPR